jgi:RNA polymerase sigma factor (sigma-70 family)
MSMTTVLTTPRPNPRVGRTRLPAEQITALVNAAQAGDQDAWNGLVQEFGAMIWAVARAHRLNDADARDVSQATWLRLVEQLGKLRKPELVGAWLATTARRECLRLLRESKRQVLDGEIALVHESLDMGPDEAVLLSERDAALRRTFCRLRPSDQALLRLLMAEPAPSYEEISIALQMPIGSIGPTRQRALERLRRELSAQESPCLITD